jgi:hypothetical protein
VSNVASYKWLNGCNAVGKMDYMEDKKLTDRVEYLCYFGLGIMQDMKMGNIMPTAFESIVKEIRSSTIEILIFEIENSEPKPHYYCRNIDTKSAQAILQDCLELYNVRIPRLEDHTERFVLIFQDKDHYGLSPLSEAEFLRLENTLPRNEFWDSV